MAIKLTPNQQKWKELVRKINRRIRNIEKRGYEVDIDIPEQPKRITKKMLNSFERLGSLENIYKNAEYIDQETGEVLSGEEGRRLERSRAARKGRLRKEYNEQDRLKFVDVVISTYREYILSFPTKVSNIVLHALNNAINSAGKEAVALALQEKTESLSDFLNRSRFFGDSIAAVIAYCSAMFGDLPGITPENVSKLSDLVDEEGS